MSMFRADLLRDKRILITGGGTGLGKGMAHRFLELGATSTSAVDARTSCQKRKLN